MNIRQIPILRGINRKLTIFREAFKMYIPPGHYYSPIINKSEVSKNAGQIFSIERPAGIELNDDHQLELLKDLSPFYEDFINEYHKSKNENYTPDNGFYSYKDAIFLYSMLRLFKPKKVYEVGSGFSSSLMQDVSTKYDPDTELTFIEPYPEERLLKVLKDKKKNAIILKTKVQDIDPVFFQSLDKNDILFIDSSHVSKVGSDLNYLLFKVLPILKEGVLIHFHDVYYPFQYPKEHVLGNRFFSWNEAFILRAFLSYNSNFKIIMWNSFLEYEHNNYLKEYFPLYFKGGSASIWLRKM